MKITSVERQKKNNKRFNIFLDGQFAFGADEDLIVNYRLIMGKEIDTTLLEKILQETEISKLMDLVYGLLSVRGRSEKEIRDYLKRFSFKRKLKDRSELSDLVIDALIKRVKEKGLINDLQFAKDWVEARRKSKQKGMRALKVELFQKGIDREIIEEVLSRDSDEENLAKIALEKKVKAWKNLPLLEFKQKAVQFLLRRGFDYQVAKSVVDNVLEK